jgi:hypothetical protein
MRDEVKLRLEGEAKEGSSLPFHGRAMPTAVPCHRIGS